MNKLRFSATVSAFALLVGGTEAWAQDVQVPPAGEGTSTTGTPYPTEQVPVTTPADSEEAVAEQVAEAEGEEIVVTGLRRSLETAATIKRRSDAIVDAIVAEDIGKLPDTFASSALARVTGVSVTRGGGESAGVTVRGLPDISTTYNGREIFTAEGRFVQIQDFPAGTVAALEVFKSSTANLIEGGIGGQVNVRGRRPFDFKGFELSGSANLVRWDQSDRTTPNGNLLISNRWDTGIGEMGLLVNASYVGINFLDSTREQALVIGTTNAGQGVEPGIRFPDAQALFYGNGDRYRPSVNAAFQWRPTSELEIYVDGLFQGYRGRDENRFLFVPIFGGLQLSNLRTRPGNPDQAESFTVANAVRPDGYYGSFNGKTNTYQVGGGAVWQRNALTVSGDIAYTDSTYDYTSFNVDFAFASSPVRNVDFDAGKDGGASFEFVDFDVTDPDNFISRGLYQERLEVTGKDVQARSDVSYDIDFGLLKRLQFGVRYNDRDATRDFGNSYVNNEGARIPLASLPVDLNLTNKGFDFDNAFDVRTFVAIPARSIRRNINALRAFFGQPAGLPAFNPTDTFRANEKSYAAYAQLKYGFDIGNTVVDGLVGLRAIKTKTKIEGFSRIEDTGGVVTFPEIEAENDYTDFLPNVSARIAFTDKLQLRLAATQTRTRPGFFDLRPNTSLGQPVVLPPGDPCLVDPTTPDCVERLRRGGSAGNPNLEPLTSNNYDASLEYYFSRSGSVTAAIFRRDAEGFLATVPDRSVPGLRIDRPTNLGETRLQGAEVAFTSFLDIDGVPEWAKGFGIQANATYIDAKGDVAPNFAATLDNEKQRFPGVSKWAYNLVALYEKPTFSARLAYNYRSKFVLFYSLEAFDPVAHPVIERGRGQLDFSTTYTPIPNVTLAFDVVNVLGNPLQRYRQYNEDGDTFERQTIYLERTYSAGVRFRF
jgi:TonB-dependent receptor